MAEESVRNQSHEKRTMLEKHSFEVLLSVHVFSEKGSNYAKCGTSTRDHVNK